MADEPDADVLRRFVHGDQAAFEQLFRTFEADVFSWILRIVRDRGQAQDVLIEAFWRAYRARAQFDPTRSFGAWMRRIATNAALDQLRSGWRRRWLGLDRALPSTPAPDHESNSAIAAAFRRLLERTILFPMAVVPNRWGVWNILWVATRSKTRLSIGAHGCVIPVLLVPAGILLARTTELFYIQMGYALLAIPVGMAVYYLAWKFLVGSLNAEVGIA